MEGESVRPVHRYRLVDTNLGMVPNHRASVCGRSFSMNMKFKEHAQQGIKIWGKLRCSLGVLATFLTLAVLTIQYLWTTWRPRYENKELIAHTELYYTGGLKTSPNEDEPQARDDMYLIFLGIFLLLEMTEW